MKVKILFILFTFLMHTLAFGFVKSDLYKLESGVYKQVAPVDVEICDQQVRVLNDDEGFPAGIYVEYIGMCLSQGPFYYFCNDEVANECYNIGHRFQIKDHNYYKWTNENSGADVDPSGFMSL